jgi:hypothetical protein
MLQQRTHLCKQQKPLQRVKVLQQVKPLEQQGNQVLVHRRCGRSRDSKQARYVREGCVRKTARKIRGRRCAARKGRRSTRRARAQARAQAHQPKPTHVHTHTHAQRAPKTHHSRFHTHTLCAAPVDSNRVTDAASMTQSRSPQQYRTKLMDWPMSSTSAASCSPARPGQRGQGPTATTPAPTAGTHKHAHTRTRTGTHAQKRLLHPRRASPARVRGTTAGLPPATK